MKKMWSKVIAFVMAAVLIFEMVPAGDLRAETLSTDAKISGGNFDAWSGGAGLWIGHNGVYADRLSVEGVSSFEGESAFAHVTINHKFDGSGDVVDNTKPLFAENSNDMFYTSYATLGVTEDEVRAWIAAGYSKLQVNYYYKGEKDLKIYANYEGAVKNNSWAEYLSLNAEKNKWSTFEIALEDVLYKYDESASDNNNGKKVMQDMNYLFKLLPSEDGTYEFYIGSGKAVKEALDTNVTMTGKNFETWSNKAGYGVSVSTDPNARLFVEDMASYNGENAVWHATINHKVKTDDTTGEFKENSLDMFYNYKPELNLTSSTISRCIEEGYNTLRIKYYYSGTNDLQIRAGYEGQDDKWNFYLDENAKKDSWSTFDISLEDVKVYVDKSFSTRNYLFRLQPTDDGVYNFYLGTAEVVKVEDEPETTTTKEDETTKEPETTTTTKAPVTTPKATQKVTTTPKATVKKTTVSAKTKKLSAKKVKLSIKKVSGATKYDIQISTTKNFKKVIVKKTSKKTSLTITSKKLKGKKNLYVRVKAYKKINKKTVGSKWSKVYKIKVK